MGGGGGGGTRQCPCTTTFEEKGERNRTWRSVNLPAPCLSAGPHRLTLKLEGRHVSFVKTQACVTERKKASSAELQEQSLCV